MPDLLRKLIDFADFDDNKQRVLYIKGTFGIGKSYLLNQFREQLQNSVKNIICYDYTHNSQTEYLHEFVYNLGMSCTLPSSIDPQETYTNRNFFLNLLNQSYTIDKEIYYLIKNNNKMINTPGFLSKLNITIDSEEIIEKYGLSIYDIDLLFKAEEMSVESFIVDMLQKHFPNCESTKDFIHQKNLLFIIDNYDKAAGSINNWLFNHFLPYIDNCKLSDLKYYEVNSYNSDVVLSEYFDIKIILAGREPAEPNKSQNIVTEQLKPMTKDQTAIAFKNHHIDISDHLEVVYQITQGLPFVLGLVAESIVVGNGEIQDLHRIEHIAAIRAMNYLTSEQQDFVRAASFLNEFDEEALGFMPLIKEKSKIAFTFFQNCHEFAVNTKSGKFAVKPNMKAIIKNQVAAESQKAARSLEEISAKYRNYVQLMNNFETEERPFIRKLAYFNNFDKIFAIQDIFGDNAAAVRKIIDKYPVVFHKNISTYKMDESFSDFIIQLENSAQSQIFEETTDQIKKSWSNYLEDLKKQLHTIDKEITDISEQIEKFEITDTKLFQEQKKCEADSSIAEINIDELKLEIDSYEKDRNIASIALPFGLSALFSFAFVLPEVEISGFFGNIFWTVLIVLLLFGLSRLFFYVKAAKRNDKYADNRNNLSKLRHDIEKSIGRIAKIKSEREKIAFSLNKIREMRNKLRNELTIIESKIKETFVREEV